MPQILSNMEILHQCNLCHQYKSIHLLRNIGGYYICHDCSGSTQKEPEPPAIIVIPKIFLPTIKDFNDFMDDIIFYESDVVPVLKDYTLTLTAIKTKKSISIDTNALLQILCSKYEHPSIHESYRKVIPVELEARMQNLYADVQDMLEHAILKYNRILAFEDSRIRELVEKSIRLHEIPLILKIDYQTWEQGLISGHISREIERGLHKRDKELSQIRQDHATALNTEKQKNAGTLEKYSSEILKLKTTIESLNLMRASAKDELNAAKVEKEEAYEKLKKIEMDMNEKVVELSKQKVEINNLKKQVEKQKSGEEWMLDITSNENEPIYINQVTGDIVKYPPDFKEKYKPITVDKDNGILIYKELSGDKEFKVPQTLSRMVQSPSNPENPIIPTNIKNKIAGNDMEVLNALSRDKEKAKTIEELHTITKIAESHIGTKHLKRLMELNMVAKFKGDDNILRFYRI